CGLHLYSSNGVVFVPGPALIGPCRPIRRCVFPSLHFQPRTGKSRPFVPQKVAEEAEDAAAFRTFDGLLVLSSGVSFLNFKNLRGE
ncbi:hypothetical protein B296_00014712, partial [Ensete ventricosum]